MEMRKPVRVVAGVVERSEGVLLARRRREDHQGGKWEFPGGKVEVGESEQTALEREFHEEFGVEIRAQERLGACIHAYSDKSVELIAWRAEHVSGEYHPLAHDEIAWVERAALERYEVAAADRFIVEILSESREHAG
ncbi:MAG TPA: (deoxy)nucleoside triphosphate pyrophosphohydrolase [Candidatus Sumerlaeota bacterium]|nr:(deoxy)nucleoside triphosphate pyrophosphohydrolase [Candidatus Sumerlaeota bacterium]